MVSTGDPVKMCDVRGPGAFDQLMRLEQQATHMFLNQPLFVPGLLQVAGYAEEMIGSIAGLKPGDAELAERVSVRMRRAETFEKRLQSASPPHLSVAIDEAVLRRAGGAAAVMREQLDHLVTMSKMDTVRLAIIPLSHGAHPGLAGSFEVHQIGSGEASVFFEGTQADEIVGTDQGLAQRYRETVETMIAWAVSGTEARALLETISSTL